MTDTQNSGSSTNSQLESSMDAHLNPYLLHHSFTPTSTLVSQPLIGAGNYSSWSRAMMMAICGKNKAGFIKETITKPEKESTLLSAWACNNDTIASWIMNSISKGIAASIVYNDSVKEIWDELRDHFKQSNEPRIYQLRKELITLRQGALSVEAYYTKLKTIWQDLLEFKPVNECTYKGLKPSIEYLDSECVMIFLMGLNEGYANVRAQILLMDPIPSITKVFSLIIQEEHHRSMGDSNLPSNLIALLVADASKRNFSGNDQIPHLLQAPI